MQLFYAPDIIPPFHTLNDEESRHAVKVLRLGAGGRLHLTDGQGNLYVAEVLKPDIRGCEVRIVETFPEYGRRPFRLTMAVAPTKNIDRYECFLEKATEIGVDTIVPVLCANSERRIFKPDRAVRILAGAMKQSLKTRLPELWPLTPVNKILDMPFDGVKLIAHCRTDDEPSGESGIPRVPITRALTAGTDTFILIGPEGDFTAEEVARAIAKGFTPISLGASRLRTETAAIAAVAAVYFAN